MLASLITAALRTVEPERAHGLALKTLRWGLVPADTTPNDPALRIDVLGCSFRNPLGLAAGFDKDATAASGLARLGFGFLELGTVTPLPQGGNPKPRLFRLTPDRAAINRMGFNSGGIDRFLAHLTATSAPVPIGANIGINKEGAVPERDYPTLLAQVAPHVQYVALNVSSPNTPGLRDLQAESRLRAILEAIAAAVPARPRLLVKIAPDLAFDALPGLIDTCLDCGVDGLIISNTTTTRPPGLVSPHAREAGGLSGQPLFALSTALLARARLIAGDRLTLIGVGGVASGHDALTKIQAGASLVQLYTSFAYAGPALIPRLKRELAQALRDAGFADIRSAIGTNAEHLARTLACST